MTECKSSSFPFTAVVGQDALKLALILTTINPLIGGVIISGSRGSAKSTLARGLEDVVPRDGEFSTPFVTLPLGASEQQVLGSFTTDSDLSANASTFQPGLLAKAHEGILYVDNVNLLPDSLIDRLLDGNLSGLYCVEHADHSYEYVSQFTLIGTMNREEGVLRPQLKDRFGLMVELSHDYSLEERVQIVRLRDEYDQDNQGFCDAFKYKQRNLRQSISLARERVSMVKCVDALRMDIASRCQDAQVEGLRADIVWVRAAIAHAAWRGAQTVSVDDVIAVQEFVLAHRRKRGLANDDSLSSISSFANKRTPS